MSILQNLPSFKVIFVNAWSSFKRFPYTIFNTICAMNFALILSNSDKPIDDLIIQKLLLVSLLGIPLFIALTMFAERHQWKLWKSFRFQTIGFLLLLMYYFILPQDFFKLEMHVIQYALLFVSCLCLNAFLPYLKGRCVNGFWQYNKSLLINLIITAIYSVVLGVGLVIAIAALEHLFNYEIDPKIYGQIWIVIGILFNTWLFLAKLPTDLEKLEFDTSYPTGLKVFTQYILLPLVGLYLFILYSYEIKLLIEWNLPVGWVSNLVLWYSVVSILSLLLLHPLRELKNNKWIQAFSKFFFRALIPLIAMLFVAILQRIADYGITEPRFIVLVMAIGLTVAVLYFVISKSKDIRIIPIAISILALVSAFSASPISKNSQQNRLNLLLTQNNLIVDGLLQSSNETLTLESRYEMSSVVSYLLNSHGVEALSMWGADTIMQTLDTINYEISKKEICTHLGFEYISSLNYKTGGDYYTLNINKRDEINIADYDKLYSLKGYANDKKSELLISDSLTCYVDYKSEDASFALYIGDSLTTYDDLGEIHIADTLYSLCKLYEEKHQPSDLSFSFIGKFYRAEIIFIRISGFAEENSAINGFDAVLLLKENKL